MQDPGPLFVNCCAEQIGLGWVVNGIFYRAVAGGIDVSFKGGQMIPFGGCAVFRLNPEYFGIAGKTLIQPDVGKIIAGNLIPPPVVSQFMGHNVLIAGISGHGDSPGSAGLVLHRPGQLGLHHAVFVSGKRVRIP